MLSVLRSCHLVGRGVGCACRVGLNRTSIGVLDWVMDGIGILMAHL